MPVSSDRPSTPRRPVSRERYLLRRLGALVLVGILVAGVVRAVGSVAGGGGETSAGGSNSGPAATDGSRTPVSTAAARQAETPATTGSPTTTEALYDGPPDAAHPATVYVAGDSDAGTFGPYLESLLDETGIVDTELEYKVSSGLSRPDFFDWPARFAERLPEVDPEIVVVTFGGNDAQGIAEGSGEFIVGDPVANEREWKAEYTRRAGEVMDLLGADGRTVIWVGIPNDDNPEVTERMQVQDEAAKAAAARRPDVVFVDTWARFSGRDGNWAEYLVDPRDGRGKDVRADDGFHLNEAGAEILALDIAGLITADLRDRGADL